MKKWLSSVVILLGLGASASEAQYNQPPITNPYIRPGTTPFYNPYLGGNYYGPLLGNPGVQRPGTVPGTGVAPGTGFGRGLAPDATGSQAVSVLGNAGTMDPLAEDITGHRTGFNSYSRYFNNQGGILGTTSPTGSSAGLNPRTSTRGGISVGARQPTGRLSTTQP